MMRVQKIIASSIASGAILFYSLVTPAFATTTLQITGNGADSTNNAATTKVQTTTVVQSNDAHVDNIVQASTNTGGNVADRNTGGDVRVDTGSATSTVDVRTSVNKNIANVDNCGCDSDHHVLISGNGADSNNGASVDNINTTSSFQDNRANIDNHVSANGTSGDNRANRNTGGDVVVFTGDATSNATVNNSANANVLNVGRRDGSIGKTDVRIVGNGTGSTNDASIIRDNNVTAVQSNDAYVDNYVYSHANTGNNRADRNTGEENLVDTGSAHATADVLNRVNFNLANVDCGCISNTMADISRNGADSDNIISADLIRNALIFQGERDDRESDLAYLHNHVNADVSTGDNRLKRNTNDPWNDGLNLIFTGNAYSTEDISNKGNVNLFNPSSILPQDLSLELTFSLGELLGSIHTWVI